MLLMLLQWCSHQMPFTVRMISWLHQYCRHAQCGSCTVCHERSLRDLKRLHLQSKVDVGHCIHDSEKEFQSQGLIVYHAL